MSKRLLLALTALGLGALSLSACAGALPQGFSLGVETAEAAEMEFTAPIQAIGADAWTIGGLSVAVTASTEIAGSPQVGDVVKVHALALGDRGLVARSIAPAPAKAGASGDLPTLTAGQEIEFVAAVVSIGPSLWTIGDRMVTITPSTEIEGPIAVGDLVKVHARVQADLSLVAREIERASADDLDDDDPFDDRRGDELEFKGVVEAIDGDRWTVSGVTFYVTPRTEIEGAIAVGDYVEIEAVWSDGVLTALEIELEDDDGPGDRDDDDEDDRDDEDDDDDDDHDGDDDDDDDDDD